MNNKKTKLHTYMRFRIFQIYGKLWSILLGHFIKHDFHISEECMVKNLRHYSKILTTSKVHTYSFHKHLFRKNVYIAGDVIFPKQLLIVFNLGTSIIKVVRQYLCELE